MIKETLIELLNQLKEATENFDISEMDHLMASLNEYQYTEALTEKMEQLSAFVSQFDIDNTLNMIAEIENT